VNRLVTVSVLVLFLVAGGCGGSGGSTVRGVVVPDVRGKPVAEARAAIADSGLTPLVQRRPSKQPEGIVLDQGDLPGSEVSEGLLIALDVSSGTAKVKPQPTPPPAEESAPSSPQEKSGGWTGVNADNYQLAKAVCRAYPKEEIARQFKLPPSANELTIAEKFAEAQFSPDFQTPVIEGCLAGLGG
jgi:PASTA domain